MGERTMMNNGKIQVLVVDDEIHCAEGVKCAIDWNLIGVDNVFTAYSMGQAQRIMYNEDIHIIISDVEMPKGSGFDLLRWIRESDYTPVIIMLTSYATFDYAKQAIEYQCLDYLLKPVNRDALMEVARRAVNVVLDERRKDENNQLAQYWNANERNRVRHFWREIIERKTLMDSREIMALAGEQHIIFDERNQYLPVLYKIQRGTNSETWGALLDEVRMQLYAQVFMDENQVVLVYNDAYLLAIAGYSSEFVQRRELFRKGSRTFVDRVLKERALNISAYIGEFKESGQVAVQYVALLDMDERNVAERRGVFFLDEQQEKIIYQRPDIEKWMADFSSGRYESVIGDVERYVDVLIHERRLNQESLTQLLQDFMQAFYIAVGEKGLQAHLLCEDDISVKLFKESRHLRP